jgi:hypothetical protein
VLRGKHDERSVGRPAADVDVLRDARRHEPRDRLRRAVPRLAVSVEEDEERTRSAGRRVARREVFVVAAADSVVPIGRSVRYFADSLIPVRGCTAAHRSTPDIGWGP